jgi:hypothetical protein
MQNQKNHKLALQKAIRSDNIFELHQVVLELNDKQVISAAIGSVLIVALFKVYMMGVTGSRSSSGGGSRNESETIRKRTYELLELLLKENTPGVRP